MGILANSVHPDKMQHDAAFHQGLHHLLRLKNFQGKKNIIIKKSSAYDPLTYILSINIYG